MKPSYLLLSALALVLAISPAAQKSVGSTYVIIVDNSQSLDNSDPQGLSRMAASWLVDRLQFMGTDNRAAHPGDRPGRDGQPDRR